VAQARPSVFQRDAARPVQRRRASFWSAVAQMQGAGLHRSYRFRGVLWVVWTLTAVRLAGVCWRMTGVIRVPASLRKAVAAVVPPSATALQMSAGLAGLSFPFL